MARFIATPQPVAKLLGLMACAFLYAVGTAGAQQEAGIIGQIVDEGGLVLPGVTVTATSPALQVPRVETVTNEQGEYRLTTLPIGTYQVDYSLTGFKPVRREGLRLGVNFTARVDIVMSIGAVEETITVTGAAPVVDVTSASSSTRLTRETLDVIPTSRNSIISLMAQAPGVRPNLDVGGSSANSSPTFRAFGQNYEDWQLLDGIVTVSPKSSNQGIFWDYTAFEEAQIQTIGSGAEVPTRGVYINTVVKSGGNQFHGSGWWDIQSPRFQGNNIDADLAAQGVQSGNRLQTRWNLSGDLGGRIIRDKVWFYSAARRRRELVTVVNLFKPDGSPAPNQQVGGFYTGKFSYQINSGNRLEAMYQMARRVYDSGLSEFTDWDSRIEIHSENNTWKTEWQGVKNNVVMTARFAYWTSGAKRPAPPDASNNPATFDQVTRRITGRGTSEEEQVREWRRQYVGSAQWFAHRNHELAGGLFMSEARSDRPRPYSRGAVGNYRLIFTNGAPFQLETYNYPVIPFTRVDYLGVHLKDTWAVGSRLTLNLGVRYAHDRGYLPEQCRVAADFAEAGCFPKVSFKTWNPVVPRVHGVYTLTADGKTVLKGGWGRFAHMRQADELNSANRNLSTSTTYRWSDRNGNRVYDPGEVNLSLTGPDFIAVTNQGGILANGVPNSDEKEPMSDEFSLSFERELIPDLAMRVTGIYARNFNQYRMQNNLRPYEVYSIPIRNADPGPDGRLGSADDPGTVLTYYEYPAAYASVRFQQPMLINDPNANSAFRSIEVAASKRFDQRWQLNASYAATKKNIPFVDNIGSGTTLSTSTFDPNAEIFASDNTWEWLGRVSAAYNLPKDVLVSINFEHRSGDPTARTVLFRGGQQILSLLLRVEPIGSSRLDNVNLADMRLQKKFRFSQGHHADVRVTVYNILNANPVLGRQMQSGASFRRPTSVVQPRILELSASYGF